MISNYCQCVFNFIDLSLHPIYISSIHYIFHLFQTCNCVHMVITNTFILRGSDAAVAVSSVNTIFISSVFMIISDVSENHQTILVQCLFSPIAFLLEQY